MTALAWREPSPSDCARFLERLRAGERVDRAAASASGHSASAYRRHARRDPEFAGRYAAAVRASGWSRPRLLGRLEGYQEAA